MTTKCNWLVAGGLLLQTASCLAAAPEGAPVPLSTTAPISRHLIPYLAQSQDLNKALALYRSHCADRGGEHDFEILEQLALILLRQGAHSADPERQLLSVYGCGLGGVMASLDILETGLLSTIPAAQMAAVQYLGRLQDDRADELLLRAMSSDSIYTRYEAALQLAIRRHPAAVGQIESLMHKLPPEFRCFFAQLFALVGTTEATHVLRHLIEDPFTITRVAALLSAARLGREELLPCVRSAATHADLAEQEASLTALGMLRDSNSLPILRRLVQSRSSEVQIAALRALYLLGDREAGDKLIALAAEKTNPFAIALLGSVEGAEEKLATLLSHPQPQIRIQAALSLLQRRDPRCREVLMEVLLRDTRDLAFFPTYSVGHSLVHWRVIASATSHQKQTGFDLVSLAVALREQVLQHCVDLPEAEFLWIAKRIFRSRQTELVPTLIQLLLSCGSPAAVALLREQAQMTGAPFTRCYSSLALLKMHEEGPWEETVRSWVLEHCGQQMIRFRPTPPLEMRLYDQRYELTPEESSRLLLEACATLADGHAHAGIDILLHAMAQGHPSNRPVLAGLLLKSLQ